MEYIFYSFSSFISFVFFVVSLSLFISNRSISSRLRVLEKRVNGDVPLNKEQVSSVLSSNIKREEFSVKEQDSGKFVKWLKDDWLMKLGALLFMIGFGWFVSYAFANGWVGPLGRISLGILAGVAIMSFGFWRMMKYTAQGAIFMALGAGMAILTIFAGRSIYGFFTPASAVLFDFIIISFIAFASYKFNVHYLAFIAQVLAFLAPLMAAGETNTLFLFSYLMFISLATLFLAGVTGWRNLIGSSLLFVGLYSLPYLFSVGSGGPSGLDVPLVLNFIYGFAVLYLISGLFAVINKGVKDIKNEIQLAALNGLLLFLWIYFAAPDEWSVLIFSFWAIIFTASSFVVFYLNESLAPFYAYGSVAVAFIGAATAMQLSGATLTIAFIIEIFLLVVSMLVLTKKTDIIAKTSWLFIIPAVMSLNSIDIYFSSKEIFTKDFFALFMMAVALVFVGRLIMSSTDQDKNKGNVGYGSGMVVFGSLYVGYIVWQFFHISFVETPDMATLASLVVYTIAGLAAYFTGFYSKDTARRVYGTALLSFVVLRLLFVDVWHMDLFGRVVTFFAIGILLMSTAFLTKRNKNIKN